MTSAASSTPQPRMIEVRRNLLKDNDLRARALRQRFLASGIHAVSLVSSPGTGKTALLERLLTQLHAQHRPVAVLVGDLATEHDAVRLARSGAPARQINTGTLCHLEARMVESALDDWTLPAGIELLFIENVGNLVCPSSYDLGESQRWVLSSVTEGEDKPLKYPTIFNSADTAIITKTDLAAAAGCDLPLLRANIETVRPGIRLIETSSRTGSGFDQLLSLLPSPAAACDSQ